MSALLLLTAAAITHRAALVPVPTPAPERVAPPPDSPLILSAPPLTTGPAPLVVAAPTLPGLPNAVRTMVEAAYKTGDDKTIDSVLGLAKANFPDFIADIEAISEDQARLLAATRRAEQEREQARIAAASFFDIWKGTIEVGGFRSTGTTRTVGLYASAQMTRDGLRWRQKVNGRLDYQETNHTPTTERWLFAWQPNYKLNADFYIYGLGQYEHDRFLGYQSRETLSTGIGYQAVSGPKLKLSLEAGPAFRYTDFVVGPSRATVAGRGSLSMRWAISPTFSLTQDGAIFLGQDDPNATSTTAMETKLIGPLKARFSYNVQFERGAPTISRRLDTTTRATLVYGF